MATPSYKIASELSERIYQHIAEKKTLPWRQGWISRTWNPVTDTKYKGINYFLTKMHMEKHNLQIPQFLTFTQVKNLGGMVKPGEKSVPIIFYKSCVRSGKDRDIDEQNYELVSDNSLHALGHKSVPREMRPSYFLRNYNIYGVEQTNLPPASYDLTLKSSGNTVDHSKLLNVIQDYCEREHIEVSYSGLRAYYHTEKDSIQIPRRENFERIEDFYFTLLHEISHSTGHAKRLARFKTSADMITSRRDQYSKEEVIADMTASLVMQKVGLSPDLPNSASYIEGWLRHFQDKKEQIYRCCRQAQRAAEYICPTSIWGNDIMQEEELAVAI